MAARVSLPARVDRLKLVGEEAISTLREVALFRVDLMPIVPRALAGDDVVVVIHGFMATAGVFRPMRNRIERETGSLVASFSHAPGLGVKRIAGQLARLVDRIPHGTRIHLVGHSLGGIVARWYVQELGGHTRVAQTISLGSPFGGAPLAEHLRVLVGNDLHAASDILARLRNGAHVGDVPHTSIAGTADRVVAPHERSHFPNGDVILLEGRGHNTLLFDREAIDTIVDCVKATRDL